MWQVIKPGDNLLNTHQRDQRLGQRAGHAAVAFVLDQHEGARLGNRKVNARDPHFGGQKNRAQPLARNRVR